MIVPRLLDRARKRREIPVVVRIDVEPDLRVFDPGHPPAWLGFERFVERLADLRERLSEISGTRAAFTWCIRMDPQIAQTWGSAGWAADAYGPVLQELVDRGDELGLHTHTWRWGADSNEWYADFEDEAWAAHCVELGLGAFERKFGRACEVHSGGDHFLTGAMLARLEASGVRGDLTVAPGLRGHRLPGESSRGVCVEYRGVPTVPYRSSPSSFPRPDPARAAGPLLVPLTSSLGRRATRVPIPPDSSPRRFLPRLEVELLRGPPVLAFAVRSDVALGPRWDAFASNLEHLARHRGTAFVTATAAVEHLDKSTGTPGARPELRRA
jgi:hypothetical protein